MRYRNIHAAEFISRPNRFIANVKLDGEDTVCHVKNTGRCRELLTENAEVFLEESDNVCRKTKYDLVSVIKNGKLINMDSQAPNIAVGEFLPMLFPDSVIRPETTYGNSRFDFYIEGKNRKIFLEVKGVTLENDGVVMFPDAPTIRGIKHLNELVKCIEDGYEAYVFFVVQMSDIKYFAPNTATHKDFALALKNAAEVGVKVLAYDCTVTPSSMDIRSEIPVKL